MALWIINGRGGEMGREEVVWMVKEGVVESMGRGGYTEGLVGWGGVGWIGGSSAGKGGGSRDMWLVRMHALDFEALCIDEAPLGFSSVCTRIGLQTISALGA